MTHLSERVDPIFGFVLRDTSRAETASAAAAPADAAT